MALQGLSTFPNWLVIACLGLGATSPRMREANEPAPAFIRSVPIGTDYFALAIRAGTTDWVALDYSTDLRTWSELASIATTNTAGLFVDDAAVERGDRFYRLRLPGTPVPAAQARWLAAKKRAYCFQLQRVDVVQARVQAGTVTVIDDLKTITNATLQGEPADNVDLADFPSVEELFSQLASAQSAGCHLVYALYDPARGYPTRCLIDQRSATSSPAGRGNAVEYRIFALEFLDTTGQSANSSPSLGNTTRSAPSTFSASIRTSGSRAKMARER